MFIPRTTKQLPAPPPSINPSPASSQPIKIDWIAYTFCSTHPTQLSIPRLPNPTLITPHEKYDWPHHVIGTIMCFALELVKELQELSAILRSYGPLSYRSEIFQKRSFVRRRCLDSASYWCCADYVCTYLHPKQPVYSNGKFMTISTYLFVSFPSSILPFFL